MMDRSKSSGIWLAAMLLLLAGAAISGRDDRAARSTALAQPPVLMQPTTGPDDPMQPPPMPDEEDSESAKIRKLTSAEINRIRFMELRGMRMRTEQPDRVTVKIPRAVVDDFLVEMEGDDAFKGEQARREFRKLTPAQKLHAIAIYRGAPYANRVEILSDPEVFVEFRKQVMPTVLQSCATAGCHSPGAGEEVRFTFFKDPKKSPETTYANFILLNDLFVDGNPVINRDHTEDSLLLTYLLPAKDVKPELRHPGEAGPKPAFQSRGALGYKRIQKWIAALKHPAADYDVHFIKPQAPAPEDEPMDAPPETTQGAVEPPTRKP